MSKSKFVVLAGSRPKRAWAEVLEVVEGKDWFECGGIAYYETGCARWDYCECCEFDNEVNIAFVLAKAGMVLTGEQVWLTDSLVKEGGLYAQVVVKA
jgi:hypothetical protein